MNYIENPNGITVKELKDILKDWPEESTEPDSSPTKVWIGTRDSRCNECVLVCKIGPYGDIILDPRQDRDYD